MSGALNWSSVSRTRPCFGFRGFGGYLDGIKEIEGFRTHSANSLDGPRFFDEVMMAVEIVALLPKLAFAHLYCRLLDNAELCTARFVFAFGLLLVVMMMESFAVDSVMTIAEGAAVLLFTALLFASMNSSIESFVSDIDRTSRELDPV